MTQYEIPIESKKKKSARIPIDKLHDFDGHPYKVTDNEDMDKLVESIKSQGIISPLIVRLKDNTTDEYEVISGHRRLHASKRAGLTEVPALIYPYTKTEAAIAVVDSNLHRERILPSEKAFAYKMKMEALKEQGKRTDLTSSQVATKSDTATEIGKAAKVGDGGRTLINLTAIIALNLGVMNLLPLPALDGGRLLFLIVEGIRRKPIKRELEGYIHFAGLVLFMLLFIFISYKDIVKLFG